MKASYKSGEFQLPPEGNHVGRLYSIIDIGVQPGGKFEDKQKIIVTFELCDELMKDGRPFAISRFYTLSLHEKSSLCLAIESMAGKKIPEEAKETFNFQKLLGMPCLIGIVHETGTDTKQRAAIKTLSAIPKGMTCPPVKNELVFFDLDAPDWKLFETFPDWIKSKVQRPTQAAVNQALQGTGSFMDDDIPF